MATVINGTRPPTRIVKSGNKSIIGQAIEKALKTETIFIGLDNPGIAETALSYVADHISKLAPEVNVKIYLLHVISEVNQYRIGDGTVTKESYTEEEKQEITKKSANYLNLTAETLRNTGAEVTVKVAINSDASKEILNTARGISADLIIMFAQKKSRLSRLVFGSITDKVLHLEDDIPVMVFRAN